MDIRDVRRTLGEHVLGRVGGDEARLTRARIHGTPGPRWFAADRPICRVHGDASMFVGGIRALLLQSLHPLAMAGVAGHSGYRGDPWGRLQRTSYFLAVTTFGTVDDAEAAVARVRGIHRKVKGTAPDGRSYAASDPHLLKWVHIAEVDSFLQTHQQHGKQPLDQAGRDGYVADAAFIAEKLGVIDPPRDERELQQQLASYRDELVGTDQALATAKFLLFQPPLPLFARGPYALLASAAVTSLPDFARSMLRVVPFVLPGTDALARAGGDVMTTAIRWAITDPSFAVPVPPAEPT